MQGNSQADLNNIFATTQQSLSYWNYVIDNSDRLPVNKSFLNQVNNYATQQIDALNKFKNYLAMKQSNIPALLYPELVSRLDSTINDLKNITQENYKLYYCLENNISFTYNNLVGLITNEMNSFSYFNDKFKEVNFNNLAIEDKQNQENIDPNEVEQVTPEAESISENEQTPIEEQNNNNDNNKANNDNDYQENTMDIEEPEISANDIKYDEQTNYSVNLLKYHLKSRINLLEAEKNKLMNEKNSIKNIMEINRITDQIGLLKISLNSLGNVNKNANISRRDEQIHKSYQKIKPVREKLAVEKEFGKNYQSKIFKYMNKRKIAKITKELNKKQLKFSNLLAKQKEAVLNQFQKIEKKAEFKSAITGTISGTKQVVGNAVDQTVNTISQIGNDIRYYSHRKELKAMIASMGPVIMEGATNVNDIVNVENLEQNHVRQAA